MKPFRSRPLGRLAVVLATSLVGLVLVAAPSGAQVLGPRAAFSGPGAEPATSRVDVPEASILCDVGVGNDVTVYDGHLNVTWAIACRQTDTGQLSPLVDAIFMRIGIRNGSSFVLPIGNNCVTVGPSATCSHRVPYSGTTGRHDSVVEAIVTWKDGYPPLRGAFLSPGITIT